MKCLYKLLMRFTLALCLLLVLACQQKKVQIKPAFYHWKSKLSLQVTERQYLDQLSAQKLYLRFFDLDWNAQQAAPIPVATLQINPQQLTGLNLVPTIFITNRTLIHLASDQLEPLVDKMIKKLQQMLQEIPQHSIEEIQIDCDWTLKTKNKYFDLLESLQLRLKDIPFSATIRLHQIKYFQKTGVPPVSRGMLMFYNMGDLDNPQAKNTILDLDIAQKYLANLDQYPLALDIAFPIFSWGVLHRDGKMIQLINALSTEQLNDSKRFLKLDENHFKVLTSTYLNTYYLYQEDLIRIEQVSPKLLLQAAELLAAHTTSINRSISFYHLDTTIIKHYPYETLEAVCQHFR